MQKRVIVDVDVGLDDYLALLVLLHAEKQGQVKIEAITCTTGNTNIENVCKNTVRLLEIAARTDIPVYKGVKQPLVSVHDFKYPTYHGVDGFGDLTHENEPDVSLIQQTPSPLAIYDIVNNNAGQIDLICLAPLTNIALTMRLYHDFSDKLRGVYIMGGNSTGVGNITPSAEFNFYADPEAAFIVLQDLKCPITIVPWEACIDLSIESEWRYNTLAAVKGPLFDLLLRAELKDVERYEHWNIADALIVIFYLHPQTSATKISKHNATVELQGLHTRGLLVLDHLKQKEPNVDLVERLSREFVQDLLMQTANSLA